MIQSPQSMKPKLDINLNMFKFLMSLLEFAHKIQCIVKLCGDFNQVFIVFFSCSEQCLLTLVKEVQLGENPELVTSLLEVLGFSIILESHLPIKTCRSVGRFLRFSADRLDLTLKPKAVSVRGTRLLFRHITNIHTLRYIIN